MKIIYVDPRSLVVGGSEPPDPTIKEMIQENGLPYTEGVLPQITVRLGDGGHEVNSGKKEVRAIVALIEEGAACIDRRTGRTVSAAEAYETIPVGLLR